ncbi:CDP-glycerol glycerophosphotransferase family protein, partial [Clavibacter michiganensis]|uniref:CDP-glycerol glycerophosphotransferase family protein n=1 Tax=Clavibacter michiganensis TaxID=28447 RepID=UPI0029300F63
QVYVGEPSVEGTVAILYAPTHRDYRRTQRSALDLERVVRRLGPRFVVLARAHPRHGGPLAASAGRVLDVSDHPHVESLCLASDALVTDYSSIMFDYAGLDRPIVIHADDREAYEAARGTYFDLLQEPPGAVATTQTELLGLLTSGTYDTPETTKRRDGFR